MGQYKTAPHQNGKEAMTITPIGPLCYAYSYPDCLQKKIKIRKKNIEGYGRTTVIRFVRSTTFIAFLAYEDASTKQVTLQSAYFSLIAATFVLSLFFFIK